MKTLAQVIEEMSPRKRFLATLVGLLFIYLIVAAVGGTFPFKRPVFSEPNEFNP